MRRIWLLIGILLLISCTQENRELRSSLRSARENRPELEDVLNHYSEEGDDEKSRAAEYLVRYMGWHQSYTGDFGRYRIILDSLIPEMTSAAEYNRLMGNIEDSLKRDYVIRKDTRAVKADFLISDIDEAFAQWKRGRWAKHLTFEEFCEYLLPYKVEELQPLEMWRREYQQLFVGNEITVDETIDEYRGEPHIAIQNIRGAAKGHVLAYSDSLKTTNLYDLRSLKDIPYGDCISLCDLGLLLYRSKGIPVAMDFVPGWADRAGSHAWLSVYTRRGVNRAVHAFSDGNPEEEVECRRFAKVYRRTYRPNPELARRYRRGYPIPARLNDIFFRDVTEEYVKCEDVIVNTRRSILGRNGYVAVFNNQRWIAIAYGKRKGLGKAKFENMARNALYLPVVVKRNGVQVPLGDPFFIHPDCKVETISSKRHSNQTISITMKRKYPVYWQLAAVYDRTRGGILEGSNTPDFNQAEKILEIYDREGWSGYHSVTDSRSFRYYRFRAREGQFCDLAELKLYSEEQFLTPTSASPKISDDDALTWETVDNSQDQCAILDLGSPRIITGIFYAVRSDGNDFYPGFEYELRRWTGDSWAKLDTFIGSLEPEHIFRNMSEGELYLITCNTTGTQSRPFVIKDNQTYWL